MKCHTVMLAALSVKLAMFTHATNILQEKGPFSSLGTDIQDMLANSLHNCEMEKNLSPYKSLLCKLFTQTPSSVARGYGYGGLGYHSYGGFDPLTLLAGLAFLAFLLQTLHALLYRAPVSILSRSNTETLSDLSQTVGEALEKYDSLSQQRRIIEDEEESSGWSAVLDSVGKVFKNYWLPYVNTPCFQNVICRVVNTYKRLKEEQTQYPY